MCHFLLKWRPVTLLPTYSLSHTHTHTLLLFHPIAGSVNNLPIRRGQSRMPPIHTGWMRMTWDAWEWQEQSSLNEGLRALPLLPQKFHQSPPALSGSVTTRHDLWAWNERWDNDNMKQFTRQGPLILTGVAAANRSSKRSIRGPFWKCKGWWMRMKWMTHKWHGFMNLMMTVSIVYTPMASVGGSYCQYTMKTLDYVPSISRWSNMGLIRKHGNSKFVSLKFIFLKL